MKKLFTGIAIAAMVVSFAFCSSNQPKAAPPKAEEIKPSSKPKVEDTKRIRSRDMK